MAADGGSGFADRGSSGGTAIHDQVAAFALGVLDEEDAARFEDHLADCPSCATELDEMLPVADLLADVGPGGTVADDRSAHVLRRMTWTLQAERIAVRRRRLGLMIAGSAAVLGAGALVAASWSVTAGYFVVAVSALAVWILIGLLVRSWALHPRPSSDDRAARAAGGWAEQFRGPACRRGDEPPAGYGATLPGLRLSAPTRTGLRLRAARDLYDEARRFERETARFSHDLAMAVRAAQSADREHR